MNVKSQADILSVVIIVIITIGLISTAYFWTVPEIQRIQDATIAERIYQLFNRNNVNSLPRKIEYIAAHGGEESFDATVKGIWTLNMTDTSIQFSFLSRALPQNISEKQVGMPWILISGKDGTGTLGKDNPLAVYTKVDRSGDRYNIGFKTKVIQLTADTKTYNITLKPVPEDVFSSVWKTIKISRGDVGPSQTNPNLIITEIKIQLL